MSRARYEWNFQIYAWYYYGNYTDAKTDKGISFTGIHYVYK